MCWRLRQPSRPTSPSPQICCEWVADCQAFALTSPSCVLGSMMSQPASSTDATVRPKHRTSVEQYPAGSLADRRDELQPPIRGCRCWARRHRRATTGSAAPAGIALPADRIAHSEPAPCQPRFSKRSRHATCPSRPVCPRHRRSRRSTSTPRPISGESAHDHWASDQSWSAVTEVVSLICHWPRSQENYLRRQKRRFCSHIPARCSSWHRRHC